MRFHAFHFKWLWRHDFVMLFGLAGGRAPYQPKAQYLYSFRVFLVLFSLEILWTTGHSAPLQETA